MNPDDALARQIGLYRGMTCEQRLKIALDLHSTVCGLARAGIRSRFPNASDDEVERQLRKRIELARR